MKWISFKTKPTQFASNKDMPGKSSSEIVERSADYFKRIAEVDTRFGYNTDMVKTQDEVQKDAESTPTA